MKNKTVGIIGGLGPGATARFYSDLISAFQKLNKKVRPSVLIYSIPLPLSVEKNAILSGEDGKKCLPFLVSAAKKLERAGADFIVMPCNSLHEFIGDIRKSIHIPVLDMIAETTKFLKGRNIPRIGLVSTYITSYRRLYEPAFSGNGMTCFNLNDKQQSYVGKIIYRSVRNTSNDWDKKRMAGGNLKLLVQLRYNEKHVPIESNTVGCPD